MKKDALALGMLGAAALFTLGVSYPRRAVARESSVADIPQRIGKWTGRDVPMTDRTYELLGTRNALLREYEAPGKPAVALCLVFSGENRKVSHPPEVCYRGDGFEILEQSPFETPLRTSAGAALRANRLFVERDGRQQAVVYWYKAGGAYTENYYRQQLRALTDMLLRRRSGYALIRISAPVQGDAKESLDSIFDFARELMPVLEQKFI